MGKCGKIAFIAVMGLALPNLLHAQSEWANNIKSLHSVLDQLYTDMIPLCTKLIGVGRGIAGFAALWYIAVRVWRHLANAESIDFYPLFKPFVIGFVILNFSSLIGLINGVLKPVVTGTSEMVTTSDSAVAILLKQKEEALKQTEVWQMYVGEDSHGDRDKWYKYTHPDSDPADEGFFDGIGNDIKFAMEKAGYNFRNSIKEWMSQILQILFAAASLCINTLRTFNLIILAILGPLAFGLGVFDGFSHTIKYWLAKYVNVFMWLPVANIFGAVIGKIQENMLKLDLSQIGMTGDVFFSPTDAGYLVFLIIGIIGYTTVPNISNYIMFVGGFDMMAMKATNMAQSAAGAAAGGAMGAAGMMGGQLQKGLQETGDQLEAVGGSFQNLGNKAMDGYNNGTDQGTGGYNAGRSVGRGAGYLYDKLKGRSSP